MRSRFFRIALLLAMLVAAVLLGADIAYLMSGSLEQFPTGEDQGKVRLVTSAIAALLLATEAGLWLAYRRLKPNGDSPSRAPKGVPPAA